MLRVGSVPYLVGRPLDLGLEDEPGIELRRAVPAELVRGLRAGELDVALVSSIELFRRPGYAWLDGPAICGRGHVSSVHVFLRRPELRPEDARTVALDPASRAAAALTRIVWPGDRRAEFLDVQPGTDPAASGADAWLRIGDAALREYAARGRPRDLNPAAEWTRRTGRPFVFAAWIARGGVDLERWAPAFLRAGFHARPDAPERFRELADRAARAWDLPAAFALHYLERECLYGADDLGSSLLAFRDAAAALGLCRGDLEPRAVVARAEDAPVEP